MNSGPSRNGKGSWVEKRRWFGCNKVGQIKTSFPLNDERPERNRDVVDSPGQEQGTEDANQ